MAAPHAGARLHFWARGRQLCVQDTAGSFRQLELSGAVDIVQEQGNFTTPTAPFGQTPPTGHSLTIVISRDTREATDIYMAEGDAPGPSLANLGRGNPTALQ
jgi:hypothetical protein